MIVRFPEPISDLVSTSKHLSTVNSVKSSPGNARLHRPHFGIILETMAFESGEIVATILAITFVSLVETLGYASSDAWYKALPSEEQNTLVPLPYLDATQNLYTYGSPTPGNFGSNIEVEGWSNDQASWVVFPHQLATYDSGKTFKSFEPPVLVSKESLSRLRTWDSAIVASLKLNDDDDDDWDVGSDLLFDLHRAYPDHPAFKYFGQMYHTYYQNLKSNEIQKWIDNVAA